MRSIEFFFGLPLPPDTPADPVRTLAASEAAKQRSAAALLLGGAFSRG
jgi:hypothetical protein